MSNVKKIRREIINILNSYLGENYLLIAFGSFIKSRTDRASDIDLAVYRTQHISARTIAEIKEALNEKAPTLREIDLVNLSDDNTNAELLKNILSEGVIWKKARNIKEDLKSLKRRLLNIKR